MNTSTLKSIPSSITVSFHNLARQIRENGNNIFDLTAGEAKLPNHPILIDAIHQTLQKKNASYPPVAGLPELRKQFVHWMAGRYHTHFDPQQCLVTAGGKYGLFMLFQALLKPGDEVLCTLPFWTSIPSMVEFFEGSCQFIHTTPPLYHMSLHALEDAITPNTRILLLNNANNPTGSLYSKEQLSDLLDLAERHDLWVISDEVYSELVYEAPFISCGQFHKHKERVFVIQSCSKNFAMTGWRLGFVLGPTPAIEALTRLQSQSLTSASIVSQWAALAALEHASELNAWVRDAMRRRRDLFINTYNKLFPQPLPPPASALYAFLPLTSLGVDPQDALDSMTTCKTLLQKEHIAMVPGIAFGMEGFARCSFSGADQDIVGALQRLAQLASPQP